MKRVLVTGAGGFVGANVALRLLREGYDLHLLARRDSWRLREIDAPKHVVDLTDSEGVADLLERLRPEWIFHLAAYGAYASQKDLARMIDVNFAGTTSLVNAALRCGCEAFIHAGSSSEYGFKHEPPGEQEWIDPNSDYAVTKAAATLYCRSIAVRHQVRFVTLRLYSVYGPYEEPTRLIPTLLVYGAKGRLPPLVNPDVARDFVYVDDVSDAFLRAAKTEGQPYGAVYNVGTGVQTSLRELVQVIRSLLNIAAEPEWGAMPNREWDTANWVANHEAISAALGWQPRYTLEAGLQLTRAWFDEARIKFYEQNRKLP